MRLGLVLGLLAIAGCLALMSFGAWIYVAVAAGVVFFLQFASKMLTLVSLVGFLTALFPKSGIKIGDFPFPFFLFGLIGAVFILLLISPRRKHAAPALISLLMLILWCGVRAVVLEPTAGVAGIAAFLAWSVIPAVILYASTQIIRADRRFTDSIELGFIFASGYAVLQQFFGIETLSIPGLTIAFGDSYDNKHNIIFSDTVEDFSKIPSTYQNGNILGVAAAVFLLVSAQRILRRVATTHDLVLFVGSAVAALLSGSRTAVVTVVIGGVVLALRGGSVGRKLAIAGAVVLAYITVLSIQPGLIERYSLDNLQSSGGGGRLRIWSSALSTMDFWDVVFGTGRYRLAEGGVGMIQQIGLVGIGLLIVFVFLVTKQRREWRFIYLMLLLAGILDSSYTLFPTWFLPAALATSPLLRDRPVAPLAFVDVVRNGPSSRN